MVIHEIRQTWMPVIIFIFLSWAWQSFSTHWDTRYCCFGLAKKAFLSLNFHIINIHSWNEINLDTRSNLHFIIMGTIIMFSSLGYTILMLWMCKKSFSCIIVLIINVHSRNEKTGIPIIIIVLLVIGTTIMIFSLGYMILMLWICKKSFSFHHFPYN